MWSIIKAELDYNQRLLLFMCLLIFPISAFAFMEPDVPGFIILLMIFVLLQNWNVGRNREHRDYQLISVPIASRYVALGRIFTILVLGLAIVAVYFVITHIFGPQRATQRANPLAFLGLLVTLFSIYYVCRDLSIGLMRRLGLTSEKLRMALMLLLVFTSLLGIVAMKYVQDGGAMPLWFDVMAKFLVGRSAAHHGTGLIQFWLISIFFAVLSLFSFQYRRSYLS